MASIFTKIIRGEIPCYKIAESESCFAFLDINPLTKGHTLVIPKKEVDYIFDIDKELYRDLMEFSKEVALAIDKTMECERVGVTVMGLEVPHAHVHLIPMQSMEDMNFSRPKLKLSSGEFESIASQIRAAI